MFYTKFTLVLSTVLASSLLLSACSSQPSTAELMRGSAEESEENVKIKKQLAADWEKGEKLVKTGEKRIKRGKERIEDAEEEIEEGKEEIERGREEIEEGRELLQKSERGFRDRFPGLDIFTRD